MNGGVIAMTVCVREISNVFDELDVIGSNAHAPDVLATLTLGHHRFYKL